MIEAVYGEAAQEGIPEGLLRASQRAEGEGSANAAQGRLNSLDLEAGYEATTAHWKDDAYAPTRLGEPTVTVRLAQWDDGRLVPWAGADPRHAWQLSQLTVRRARISGESPGLSATALEAVRGSMPDQGKHCVVLPLESGQEGWIGSVKNGKGEAVRVCYDGRFGLQYLGGDGL